MKITGPQIISELREKLQFGMGRHLYAVMGTYEQLRDFEENDIGHASLPDGKSFPNALNLNRYLLASIGDDDLKSLVGDEAKRPQAVKRRLNNALNNVLGALLAESNLLILKNLELVFAYELDLSLFKTRATNQNHILLLLPGERRSDHITIFHEATIRFHRSLPANLIADNHLWELIDG